MEDRTQAPASPGDQELQGLYEARFAGRTEYRLRVWKVLCAHFSRHYDGSGIVLDLGAGYCEFINQATAGRKLAMDLNPDVRRRAAPGVEILLQDCSSPWPIPDASLGTVFTSNFLEHLPDKATVRSTLVHAFRALRPGGHLIAMGPNIKHVPGAYWDFFDHHVPLTEASLSEVLRNCGFEIETCRARFLPYTMSDGRTYPAWMLELYLAMPALWRLFGKQFLVVARRPAEPLPAGVAGNCDDPGR